MSKKLKVGVLYQKKGEPAIQARIDRISAGHVFYRVVTRGKEYETAAYIPLFIQIYEEV